ncbi:MAG: hypothetical protein R2699_08925 [Acidimicrobiales bacterium]
MSDCSTAAAPSEAYSSRASSTGSRPTSASASSTAAVLPLPSRVECATLSSWARSASSNSGIRWPRVVTHSDEMASR